MSKTQLKKIARKKHLEETRAEWKAKKRVKDKARKKRQKEEKRAARAQEAEEQEAEEKNAESSTTGQKRRVDEEGLGEEDSTTKKRKVDPHPRNKPILEPITLIIDCAFDELMTERVCKPCRCHTSDCACLIH
jgi:tRNA (guanine9-N1)-methyltransferase